MYDPPMLRASFLGFAAIAALAACAADSSVSQEDADTIWRLSNDILHEFHAVEILESEGPIDESSSYACPDGGTIDMTVVFRDGDEPADSAESVADLLHTFDDCTMEGITVDGPFDYFDIEACSEGGFDFEIEGEVDVTGDIEATCPISGAERCVTLSGTVCDRDV